MPDIKEQIIVDVQIDNADAGKQVDTLTKKITGLNSWNRELVKTNKDLEKSGKANTKEYIDNAKQIEINKQKIGENTASRKSLITTIRAEDNSIKSLQVRNKELVKQRNEISTSTAEGRAKIALLNKEIDNNNATIRTNVSQLEKQKINIGNYASALDRLIPGLGSTVSGIQATTTASKAFIATPIGAVIAALGLAIAAVTNYFRSSEEGQNKFAKISRTVSIVVGNLSDKVAELGKFLVEAFEDPGQSLQDFGNLIKDFILDRIKATIEGVGLVGKSIKLLFQGEFSKAADAASDGLKKIVMNATPIGLIIGGATKAVEEFNKVLKESADEIAQGSALEDLKAQTDLLERQLIVQREVLKAKIAELKLRGEDRNLDIKERSAALQEAMRLQDELSAMEIRVARNRFEIKKTENSFSNSTKEDLNEQARLEAALFLIQKDNADKKKEIFTKDQAFQQEIRAQEQAAIVEHEEKLTAFYAAEQQKRTEDEKKAAEERIKTAEKEQTFHEQLGNARRSLATSISDTIRQLAGKNKALAIAAVVIEKAAAIAGIIANTAVANAKAVAVSPLTFGMPWVGINTASGIAAGIGVAAQAATSISQISGFADGGLSGTKIMTHHGRPVNRSNGDNRLATVRTGEVILNERQQAALGGASTFKSIGVPGFAQGGFAGDAQTSIANQRSLQSADIDRVVRNVMANMPPILVTVDDINTAQQRRAEVVDKASLF